MTRRRAKLKERYGITEERYDAMLAAQGGECLGCGVRASDVDRRFAIDHAHDCCPSRATCGRCIRGLLCKNCNFAVGHAYDNPQTLERLAAYLRGHSKP